MSRDPGCILTTGICMNPALCGSVGGCAYVDGPTEPVQSLVGTVQMSQPQSLTWRERIDSYAKHTGFPVSLSIGQDGRVFGIWVMGNNYQVASTYYGGYPHGYLQRMKGLFLDKKRVLHLFSGEVDLSIMPGDTVDLKPNEPVPFSAGAWTPNPPHNHYVDDAQTLKLVPVEQYDLVMADPPYSVEDCEHYGTSMVKRNKVMDALGQRLQPGAHVVWLDQVLPMYRKADFEVEAYIGMVKSTNHRFRVITIFRKL